MVIYHHVFFPPCAVKYDIWTFPFHLKSFLQTQTARGVCYWFLQGRFCPGVMSGENHYALFLPNWHSAGVLQSLLPINDGCVCVWCVVSHRSKVAPPQSQTPFQNFPFEVQLKKHTYMIQMLVKLVRASLVFYFLFCLNHWHPCSLSCCNMPEMVDCMSTYLQSETSWFIWSIGSWFIIFILPFDRLYIVKVKKISEELGVVLTSLVSARQRISLVKHIDLDAALCFAH